MSTSTSSDSRASRRLARGRRALLMVALAASGAWAADPSPAELAKQGQELADQSCQSDGYDEADCAKARDLLARAAQQAPDNTESRLALARATWNSAFTHPPEDPKRDALKQQGLSQYRALVDADVKDARPYLELGRLVRDEAARVPLLEKAVKLDPRNAESFRRLSETYLNLGRAEDAVRTYQHGMSTQPKLGAEEAGHHVELGKRLAALGRGSDAAWVFDNVLSASSGESRERRCHFLAPVKDKDYAPSGELSQKLQALRAFCPQATEHRDQAAALEKQGKTGEAVQELQKQIQATPKHEESYLTMQRLLVKDGKVEQAAQVAGTLLRVEEDPAEKCRLLDQLHPSALGGLDAKLTAGIRAKCAAKR